jgi:phosphatidate phosphatase PAH1
MQTYTTSSYDVVVIRHKNQTLKSTPFQAVFAEKSIKRDPKKGKLKDLQLFVNDELIDVPMRIDPNNGRVQFQKVSHPRLRNTYVNMGTSLTHPIFQTTRGPSTPLRDKNACLTPSKMRRYKE